MANYHVLSTKLLLPQQYLTFKTNKILLTHYSSIKIVPNQAAKFPANIEHAIITSQNSFKAIKDKTKIKKAYVVGEKTATLLKQAGVSVICWKHYAVDLLEEIIAKHQDAHFYFPCSSIRRDTLPEGLKQNNIKFTEVTAYHTSLNPKSFETDFDAILFFSPSGVNSYLQKNQLKSDVLAFCIGTTTAEALKTHTQNIIIAEKPTVEELIATVIKYFKYKITKNNKQSPY